MQNTSAYEAWWRFIVKAVCFGQIRASPIVFQVRYVLGGWCYIMAPLNIFPWFPGWVLQIHLTWTPIVHEASSNFFVKAFFAQVFFRQYTRHSRMGHSPHLKSLRPKVELLKDPFSGEHCKKETLCLCVCAWTFWIEVKLVLLFQQGDTAYHWDCVQRSYQWYGILDLINLSYLHFEMNIAMVMLKTCCFVWFFFSCFQAIASTHEKWNGNTLHQDT